MSNLFLDTLFAPDPGDPSSSPHGGGFSSGNPFTLPELYPPSVLATSARDTARQSHIFSAAGLKGCNYGHHEHIAKKQRLTYQQDSTIHFATKFHGSEKENYFWQPPDFGLFKLPEEFTVDCRDLWGTAAHSDKNPGSRKNENEDSSDGGAETEDDIGVDTQLAEEEGDNGNSEDDLWLSPHVSKPLKKPRYQTWDSFLLPDGGTPMNPYLTEAGSHVFDAVLELHQNDIWSPREAGTVIRSDVFLICLLHLGLGHSSVLFRYNHQRNTFFPVKEGLRLSGFSAGMVASIVKIFIQCGKNMKALQRFSERVYKEVSPIPTRVALAECTTTVLSALQTRLSIPFSSITSILHLESLFREPSLILETFFRIILEMKGVKEDSKLLSKLFDVVQRLQFTGGICWLRPILVELMRRVSRAWLEVVEQWIGLRGTLGVGLEGEWENRKGFFVKVQWETEVDERGRMKKEMRYVFNKSEVPGFMTTEDAEVVFECGKSLRFLNRFHPGHPLSRPGTLQGVETLTLDWKFSWEDLDEIHIQAMRYESALRAEIAKYTESGGSPSILTKQSHHDTSLQAEIDKDSYSGFDIFAKSETEVADILSASAAAMSAALPSLDTPKHLNPLRHVVMHTHRAANTTSPDDYLTSLAPPLGITPLLSFSHIFSVQSRIVNAACLHMFFAEHSLRHHFSLLYRFLLLGDGVFAKRIGDSLFSDERGTTERREGEFRTGVRMGLHIASRDSWPPASSELRLALAGLLSEAYHDSKGQFSSAQGAYTDHIQASGLPGLLSFAIRDMSPEEYESVMDPHALYALDFLKINYSPPSPLGEVITSIVLYKYDRTFKLLLRLVRMRFVVDQLWRDAFSRTGALRNGQWERRTGEMVNMKFRIGARHFVSCFVGYVWDIAIGGTWRAFEDRLDAVERALEKARGIGLDGTERKDHITRPIFTLAQLTAAHSAVLDRIMFLAFLRRRQAPIMDLLEQIFSLILKFSRYLSTSSMPTSTSIATPTPTPTPAEIEELYYLFRKKVKTFVDVVRGLSEKRGYGDGRVISAPPPEGGGHLGGGSGTSMVSTSAAGVTTSTGGEGAVFQNLLIRLEMNDYWK